MTDIDEQIRKSFQDLNAPFCLNVVETHILGFFDPLNEKHAQPKAMLEESFRQIREIGQEVYEDVANTMRLNLSIGEGALTPEQKETFESRVVLRTAQFAREQTEREMSLLILHAAVAPYMEQT